MPKKQKEVKYGEGREEINREGCERWDGGGDREGALYDDPRGATGEGGLDPFVHCERRRRAVAGGDGEAIGGRGIGKTAEG